MSSHLIPAAVYGVLGTEAEGICAPVVVTDGGAVSTSKQVQDHFLCAQCEQLLSGRGENEVLRWIWRSQSRFRFARLLGERDPSIRGADYLAYERVALPEVPWDSFAHFAAGVFWKMSAHQWRMGPKRLPSGRLGSRYQEQFRGYLAGASHFPEYASLTLTVSSDSPPFPSAIFPRDFKHREDGGYYQHRFYVPGVEFVLWLGQSVSADLRAMSIAGPGGGLYFASTEASPLIVAAKRLAVSVPARGKLARAAERARHN